MKSKAPTNRSQPLNNERTKYDIAVIQRRVAEKIRGTPKTLEELEEYLVGWWCRHYNRPYKDIQVLEYTLEELLYEFFDIQLRQDPTKVAAILKEENPDDSKEDEDWLKKMMGDKYMSREDQESALERSREEIETSLRNKGVEQGFSATFDLDEFK